MRPWKELHIVVLGAGESGLGAAILAKKLQAQVLVSDTRPLQPAAKAELEERGIPYEEGGHTEEKVLQADLVIKSPGIPLDVPIVQKVLERDIPLWDEIEFAAQHCEQPIFAITGSNGKTTTTKLLHHLLSEAGLEVGLGGNIGKSFARQLAEGPKRVAYVLELSSFQLDLCYRLRPAVAILLNITPDHLDRYENDFGKYAAAKMRITQQQGEHDHFIYLATSRAILQQIALRPTKATTHPIRPQSAEELRIEGFQCSTEGLPLQGPHNAFNMACAAKAALLWGLSPEEILRGLRSFENEPHRMEEVAVVNEVLYINDSKATNVDAVLYALKAMQRPTVWIVGGVDKGNDYELLRALVREKVRAIVCLGKDNQRLLEAFKEEKEAILEAQSMGEALKIASLYAEPGDNVLLSPACASFDLFENYKDRGNQFKEIVAEAALAFDGKLAIRGRIELQLGGAEHEQDNL